MKKMIAPILALFVLGACSHKAVEPQTPPTPPPAPAPTKAQAVLKPAKDSKIKGVIHFMEEGGEVKVEAMVEGLKAGPHGFHIHETGDCTGDFSSAGGHFNPTSAKHGSMTSAEHHAGDMGNLVASKKGKAATTLTLKTSVESLIGKAVIIHKGKDDLKSQPAGNSGPREACGIIEAL